MDPEPEPLPETLKADEWGLPPATTRLDEPLDLELGYSTDDDPESDPW